MGIETVYSIKLLQKLRRNPFCLVYCVNVLW